MELDTTLVMKEFISGMGSLFVLMGFAAIIALCLAGAFAYLNNDEFGD
jgi:hypothetical protein